MMMYHTILVAETISYAQRRFTQLHNQLHPASPIHLSSKSDTY